MIFVNTIVISVESSAYYNVTEGRKGTVIDRYLDEGKGQYILEVRDMYTNNVSVSPEHLWEKVYK